MHQFPTIIEGVNEQERVRVRDRERTPENGIGWTAKFVEVNAIAN